MTSPMNVFMLSAATALALLAAPSHAGEPVTPDEVEGPQVWGAAKNVTRLHHLYFAGQPDDATLERAASEGIVAVINLRDPSEHDWDERAAAEKHGIAYHQAWQLHPDYEKGSASIGHHDCGGHCWSARRDELSDQQA
mgnify:CR=1 FL=1